MKNNNLKEKTKYEYQPLFWGVVKVIYNADYTLTHQRVAKFKTKKEMEAYIESSYEPSTMKVKAR